MPSTFKSSLLLLWADSRKLTSRFLQDDKGKKQELLQKNNLFSTNRKNGAYEINGTKLNFANETRLMISKNVARILFREGENWYSKEKKSKKASTSNKVFFF